jgi:hypothetical protein
MKQLLEGLVSGGMPFDQKTFISRSILRNVAPAI